MVRVALMSFVLPLAGCITVRPVMVDRKTSLENDILGGFERIQARI